jgi:hypothetical protein
MATKAVAKKAETAVAASEEALASLGGAYPQEQNTRGIILPRIGLVSQDITETIGTGRNKEVKIIQPAGEFYIERESDELDENGKKKWEREYIGDEFEGIIFYKRYQLSHYDGDRYTSSPVYDTQNEIIPLFLDRKQIKKGTPAELKEEYMYTDTDKKRKCSLQENRILYVLYNGETYQMNLRGSSMFALLAYERNVVAPTVITKFSSETREKGDVVWNQMKFTIVRKVNAHEAEEVLELQQSTTEAIAASKAAYQSKYADEEAKANQSF